MAIQLNQLTDLKSVREKIDQGLDRLTTHETFLKTVGLALNVNVYRKRWTRRALEKTLVTLELPVRSDQERLLSLIQEMQDKIDEIEHRQHVRS